MIVDHGELYLECIDTFEEIFEIDKKLVEDIELTNILDPYLFSNHRDIINALFEVYYDMGQMYLDKCYDPQQANQIKNEAADRIERKYQLGKYDPFN